MSDGVLTPGLHDGMAVVDTLNDNPDWLVLVRNHEEDGINRTAFGNNPAIIHDKNAAGGTTAPRATNAFTASRWPLLAANVKAVTS
jgi:hypothetical protein